MPTADDGPSALAAIWIASGLDPAALQRVALSGGDPVLPSSFAVARAAQVSIAAAALAATEIGRVRNGIEQRVAVDAAAAAIECSCRFAVDGRSPDIWDKLSGLYRCTDGWLRIHANFAHHRDAALRLLGLPAGDATPRSTVEQALAGVEAVAFEQAAAEDGAVVAALRSFDEWDAHPQGLATAAQPLITWERTADAPPQPLPELPPGSRPLAGLRVVDMTRILAGPIAGRTLAAYGAEVMLVNSPKLPNIESIAETSRGKRSCLIDLETAAGREALASLIAGCDVVIRGYRPGSLDERGFSAAAMAALRPGLAVVTLSAYGDGPWSQRRGFDSLVQTASGFNRAEAEAAGEAKPRALPMQVLDCATGYWIAFAAQAARLRQARAGGSWDLRLSLARTGLWLRGLGRVERGFEVVVPDAEPYFETSASGWGELKALRHAAVFERTPAAWDRPSVRPGTDAPTWTG